MKGRSNHGRSRRRAAALANGATEGSAVAGLAERIEAEGQALELPAIRSFAEFLAGHARVRAGSNYVPYHFAGREALAQTCEIIDRVLGSETGQPLKDSSLAICGGAQFGKTIIVLNLKAYVLGVLFRNCGYYLPDDDLVQGIVDTKFRPDVLDQIPWLANLTHVGKSLNQSGKAVNRKGAFMVTDGKRSAQGYMRGMGKIPTTFSMDVLIEDEKDDIPEARAKFLTGRLTSSDLRFRLSIGTQRYHGAGQNKEFLEGTQHVVALTCPQCGRQVNPEEGWPQICRMAVTGQPRPTDPALTYEGDFKRAGEGLSAAPFDPTGSYYLACDECGAELDRRGARLVARFPKREALRKWSVRISQIGIAAIELNQIVADWRSNAVKDPECMAAFCCDRLAMPKSTSQALTPRVLERARALERFSLSLDGVAVSKAFGTPATSGAPARYAGLDMGDRCWFVAREVESPLVKRVIWLEQLSAEKIRSRVPALFQTLGLTCLFVDAGPLRDTSRDLCLILNGLVEFQPPRVADPDRAFIAFPGGLVWDGPNVRWRGLRAAAVEFTLKDSQGVKHKLGITQDGRYYPLIQCHRDETIQRVVNEFLTAEEGVIDVRDGRLRTEPLMRLPRREPGAPAILEVFDRHLLTGSRKERDEKGKANSFVDHCENHFLLADAYSALAENVASQRPAFAPGTIKAFDSERAATLAGRRDRNVSA